VNPPEDLLEKGFQLAYFIVRSRAAAIQILGNAMSKLGVQRSREKKRSYWRYKNLKRKITRIVRDDRDVLQWLIYFESEQYEKQQEQAGVQTTRDMIVRYIKHLAQMTTAMSSFYVNVGLHRLLHNYSTSEAQRVYEWVTQHYPGTEEYRKVKGALMSQLEARFQNFVRKYRANHGELRFEVFEEQEVWANLVDECLRFFTPWSQPCLGMAGLEVGFGGHSQLLIGRVRRRVNQDVIETYRCHVFIDPLCFGQLTEKLSLDSPRLRLAVPRFFFNGKTNGRDNSERSEEEIPKLTETERRTIIDRVARDPGLEQRVAPRVVTVMVHGIERARLDVDRESTQRFEIQEGVKLIEFWTQDQGEKVLFGTHWVDYTEWQGIAQSTATVALGKGRELLLETIPASPVDGGPTGASILLKCRPVSRLAAWGESLRSCSWWRYSMPKYALALLSLIAVGWILGTLKYRGDLARQQANIERINKQLAQEKAERAALKERLDSQQGSAIIIASRLTPDDLRVRGPKGMKEAVVSMPPQVILVVLELPVSGDQSAPYRVALRPISEKREILSENYLKPEQRNGSMALMFALPSSLIEDGKHYVVDLYSTNAVGNTEKTRTFTFSVLKE
jgi:hypothetical protein